MVWLFFTCYSQALSAIYLLFKQKSQVLQHRLFIGGEIDAHATCIITDGNSHNYEVPLNQLPAVRGDCQRWDRKAFINQVQHGVTIGCNVRIFIDNLANTEHFCV